jgi:putative glycosyltransferase (TIGR04372 family)
MRAIGVMQFIKRQVEQIMQGGVTVLIKKIKLLIVRFLYLPLYILAIPVVLMIRMIKPWLLVRLGELISSRIGHFAANTELYLCEQDAGINIPSQRYIDIFYMAHRPICNQQLAIMWQRVLRIWPSWILAPIARVNQVIPGGKSHEVGQNTQHDRDLHNLLDRFPPHVQFTTEEAARGEAGLRVMGIPIGVQFVCLTVRDSAYLAAHQLGGDYSYHNYRDSDVQNYVLAAEALAERGFFVIRMGAKVHTAINSVYPKVIDYATNGMRNDFMDIYLGAKCAFCISVGTGFDAVPYIFRRPIAYVNMVPVGYLHTYRHQFLGIVKHHYSVRHMRELSLMEILTHGVGFCMRTSDYESAGVELIENTPQEIRDVVIEMVERLNGTWQPHDDDEELQRRFWELFPKEALDDRGHALHGEIRARFGAWFLRNNREWLHEIGAP